MGYIHEVSSNKDDDVWMFEFIYFWLFLGPNGYRSSREGVSCGVVSYKLLFVNCSPSVSINL